MNLANHFLIAMPTMEDEVFSGSVVYITEHSVEAGAIGVIVNKPLGTTLKNVFKSLDLSKYNQAWSEEQLYLGGPMSLSNGFVLHRTLSADGSPLELTNDKKILDEIARGPFRNELFIALGYAAWATGDLEREIGRNDWLVVDAHPRLIFEVEPSERYFAAMRQGGIHDVGSLYLGDAVMA